MEELHLGFLHMFQINVDKVQFASLHVKKLAKLWIQSTDTISFKSIMKELSGKEEKSQNNYINSHTLSLKLFKSGYFLELTKSITKIGFTQNLECFTQITLEILTDMGVRLLLFSPSRSFQLYNLLVTRPLGVWNGVHCLNSHPGRICISRVTRRAGLQNWELWHKPGEATPPHLSIRQQQYLGSFNEVKIRTQIFLNLQIFGKQCTTK